MRILMKRRLLIAFSSPHLKILKSTIIKKVFMLILH